MNTIIYIECKEIDHLFIFNSISDEENIAIEEALMLITEDYEITNFPLLEESDKEYYVTINSFDYIITTQYCDEICQVYSNKPNFNK